MPTVHIGHSPDPDDAFMFWALAKDKIPTGDIEYVHHLEDIETLNRRAEKGDYELTAVSYHGYCFIADKYRLLRCGSSFGDNYGPILVARKDAKEAAKSSYTVREFLQGKRVAVPGMRTSAWLTLQLFAKGLESWGEWETNGASQIIRPAGPKFQAEEVPFDQILKVVADGQYDAGLVIHEGQLTYGEASDETGDGLVNLVDLGVWWKTKTSLPLPLGGNAIRKDIADDLRIQISRDLYASVDWALKNRKEALGYAGSFGRGLDDEKTDRFVDMYVNDYTMDCGDVGLAAIKRLLSEGRHAGVINVPIKPEWEVIPEEVSPNS